MSNKITIILTRANWCPHCEHFEPIYKIAKDIHKEFGEFQNYEVDFEDYDLADEDIKNTFMLNHFDIKDKVKGYPTVFINFKNKNYKNNYQLVDHTVVDEKINKNEQHEEAAKRFIKNICNVLMNFKSENKVLHLQQGGNNMFESSNNLKNKEIYKKKYLKYKSKYLELKNKI